MKIASKIVGKHKFIQPPFYVCYNNIANKNLLHYLKLFPWELSVPAAIMVTYSKTLSVQLNRIKLCVKHFISSTNSGNIIYIFTYFNIFDQ